MVTQPLLTARSFAPRNCLKVLLASARLLSLLDARSVSCGSSSTLTSQHVHETTTGLERSGEITFGFAAIEVEHGGLGPDSWGRGWGEEGDVVMVDEMREKRRPEKKRTGKEKKKKKRGNQSHLGKVVVSQEYHRRVEEAKVQKYGRGRVTKVLTQEHP